MTRQRSPHAPTPFCPVRDVLAALLDRWSLLVLRQLREHGRCRFGTLRVGIPDVSPRMLTLRLQQLQAAGVVARFAFAEVPPRVEYKLTAAGRALVAALQPVEAWAIERGATGGGVAERSAAQAPEEVSARPQAPRGAGDAGSRARAPSRKRP